MPEFYIILSATLFLSMVTRSRNIMYSALILAGVWLAWCAYIMQTENYHPWQIGVILDSLAALYLVKLPSNRPKAALAGTFCIMVLMNMAYGLILMTGGTVDNEAFDALLDSTGWAQLLLVGGWACGNIGGRALHHWGLWPSARYSSHHKHMDKSR